MLGELIAFAGDGRMRGAVYAIARQTKGVNGDVESTEPDEGGGRVSVDVDDVQRVHSQSIHDGYRTCYKVFAIASMT